MISKMISDDTQQRVCFYCGSSIHDIVYEGARTPSVSDFVVKNLNLVKCRNCGVLYVNPSPASASLMRFYPQDYYSESETNSFYDMINKLNSLRSPLKKAVNEIIDETKSTSDDRKVLEIGCAGGTNLIPLLRKNWMAYGIEPNTRLAQEAKANGIVVSCGFVNNLIQLPNDFDFIILNHVLEHDYNPRDLLQYCFAHMKHNSKIFVEIPVFDCLSFYFFGRYWGELEFPVHLSLMKSEHIFNLLERTGFEIESRKIRTLWGDNLRSLRHWYKSHNAKSSTYLNLLTFSIIVSQLCFLLFNVVFKRGEAVAIVARKP